MTLEELNKLVTSGESETLELKETTGQRVDACEYHEKYHEKHQDGFCP